MNTAGNREQIRYSFFTSHVPWLAVPILIITLLILRAADLKTSFESPNFMLAMNIIFSMLMSLFVVYLISRSFLARETLGKLMLGCGVIFWGLAGSVGIIASTIENPNYQFDINTTITIHNISVCFSGLCHLTGVILSLRRRIVQLKIFWMIIAYGCSLFVVGLITLLSLENRMPLFFIQGQGGTTVRFFVLGSAVAMFALTAILLRETNTRPLRPFVKWYSLALWLIAVGLFGIMIEIVHGGILSWTARFAQYLSGVYMIIAAIASLKESGVEGISLQEALRESEEKYHLIQELSPDGFLIYRPIHDAGGNVTDFIWIYENDAAAKMNNTNPQEVIGKTLLEVLPNHNKSPFHKAYVEVAQTGQSRVVEEASYEGDNFKKLTWFRVVAIPTGEGDVAVLAQDITVRKQAEESLRQLNTELEKRVEERIEDIANERKRFYDVLETLPVYVCLLTPDYRMPFANKVFREWFGYSPDKKCYEFLFNRTEPCEICDTYNVLKTHRPGEWEWTGPNGRNYSIFDFPFKDTDGSILILEMGIDVTEQKKAQAATQNERQRFLNVLDTLPVIITIIKPDHTVAWTNRAYRVALGDNEGKLCYASQFDRDKPCDECEAFIPLKTGKPHHWEWALPNGRTYDIYNFPFADSDGSPLILEMDIDVTEQRKAQQAIAEMNELLETRVAERTTELHRSNSELEQFAYVASHDLREPLRAISGFAGLLEQRYKDKLDEKGKGYIDYITKGVVRMDGLLSSLLEYSRVDTRGQLAVETDAQEALKAAVANLQRIIKESNAVISNDILPMVKADRTQLAQLFQNLIHNAIKFRNNHKPEIHIGSKDDNGKHLFWVKDNGIGIRQESYERIFKIFQRLHTQEEYPGHGIGLSICKKIVERHGGEIWVESEKDKGSTFYFTIPSF